MTWHDTRTDAQTFLDSYTIGPSGKNSPKSAQKISRFSSGDFSITISQFYIQKPSWKHHFSPPQAKNMAVLLFFCIFPLVFSRFSKKKSPENILGRPKKCSPKLKNIEHFCIKTTRLHPQGKGGPKGAGSKWMKKNWICIISKVITFWILQTPFIAPETFKIWLQNRSETLKWSLFGSSKLHLSLLKRSKSGSKT